MTSLPLLVVDAANVMGARPEDKWWRDRAGTARRLLSRLTGWPQEDWDVTLVVEGVARAGVPEGDADGVRVVHAQGSGDDEIVRVVADSAGSDAGRPVTVVTADRELCQRVRALGAETAGPGWLCRRLDPAP
ncbi:MAG: hypothetical protein DLM59_17945 [Pseudonocardiales bacterium]|nr:MAG: hypothetical protein DLM59_17945 [Pseudonocardiales bacterium]